MFVIVFIHLQSIHIRFVLCFVTLFLTTKKLLRTRRDMCAIEGNANPLNKSKRTYIHSGKLLCNILTCVHIWLRTHEAWRKKNEAEIRTSWSWSIRSMSALTLPFIHETYLCMNSCARVHIWTRDTDRERATAKEPSILVHLSCVCRHTHAYIPTRLSCILIDSCVRSQLLTYIFFISFLVWFGLYTHLCVCDDRAYCHDGSGKWEKK